MLLVYQVYSVLVVEVHPRCSENLIKVVQLLPLQSKGVCRDKTG